jgi:hypothetical protein
VTDYSREERDYGRSTRKRERTAPSYSRRDISMSSCASANYTGDTLNQRRIIDDNNYDKDSDWRDPDDKNLFLASDAPPDMVLAVNNKDEIVLYSILSNMCLCKRYSAPVKLMLKDCLVGK